MPLSHPITEPLTLDPLEPRRILAANFVGVGLGYEHFPLLGLTGGVTFVMEGSVSDTGSLTGTMTVAGESGPIAGVDVPQRQHSFLAEGRILADYDPWEILSSDVTGGASAQFLDSRGYSIGWGSAEFNESAVIDEEVAYLVERPSNATLSDLQGTWQYYVVAISGGTITSVGGFVTVTGTIAVTTLDPDGTPVSVTRQISSIASSGAISFQDHPQDLAFLSVDKSVMLTADVDRTDGVIYIGVAYRVAAAPSVAEVAGNYRTSSVLSGSVAQEWLGEDIGIGESMLNLRPDGTFTICDLTTFDLGHEDVLYSGSWTLSGSRISLTATGVGTLNLDVARDRDALCGGTDAFGDEFLVVATRTRPASITSDTGVAAATYAGENSDGQPTVWEMGMDGFWREVNLVSDAGGPADATDQVSWIDQDGRTWAATISPAGVVGYVRADGGTWSSSNLTQAIPSAIAIDSQLQVIQAPDGSFHIMGLTAAGDVVRYLRPAGSDTWQFHNITDQDLVPGGQVIPAFVGGLESYATSWGGLNLAGIDASGDIWSIWWAPGLTSWQSSNLSQITGAEFNLIGGLTVYLTSWNGINIAGVDDAGDIQVVWWVPSFVGDWAESNLTDLFNGPSLTPQSVSSYTTTWDGLNIVGFDVATGQVQVYWWAPGLDAWNVASLSLVAGAAASDPVTDLEGIAGTDGSLNVLGYAADGDLIRYFWQPGFGGRWLVEDITESA